MMVVVVSDDDDDCTSGGVSGGGGGGGDYHRMVLLTAVSGVYRAARSTARGRVVVVVVVVVVLRMRMRMLTAVVACVQGGQVNSTGPGVELQAGEVPLSGRERGQVFANNPVLLRLCGRQPIFTCTRPDPREHAPPTHLASGATTD